MFYLMMQLYPYISYLSTMFYYFFLCFCLILAAGAISNLCFLSEPCCWVYIKFLPEKFLRNQIWKEFCQAQVRLRPTAACETARRAEKEELSYKKFDIDPPAVKLPGRQRADPPAAKLPAGNEQTHPRQSSRQATSRPTRGNVSAGGIWLRELAYTTNPPAGFLPEGLLCII